MHNYLVSIAVAVALIATPVHAQEENDIDRAVHVHGTVRGKYEYQPQDKKGRFQVRTARVSLDGKVNHWVSYKAEIDLSDEGKIKMLDAYTRLTPISKFDFTIGQMRVPFTIDAHRSPHQQYFANRSFIAKQVGNVRDVGATLGYTFNVGFPIRLEAGAFNGSGLTNQKDYWTNSVNYSAKAQIFFPHGFNLTLSTQKIKPDHISVMMYDVGTYYHGHNWHVELEYLYKHYDDGAFHPVHAVDAFVNYDIKLRNKFFVKVSPLLRYDFMNDHSDGIRYLDGKENEAGEMRITDYKRSRVTGGVTLSLDKPFISDIRLNYEKYFYGKDGIPKPSEKDKFVIEFMTRF
ncbi:UNVERIFIED_CONTAM: OprO/OprP family phosphate-selective porin [Prevotella sp. 15_C9]